MNAVLIAIYLICFCLLIGGAAGLMYANIYSINEQMKKRVRTTVRVDTGVENDTSEEFEARKAWLEEILEK